MKINKIYKYSKVILIFFIILLKIQAFDQSFGWGLNKIYPKFYFMTYGTKSEGWNEFIWFENGLVETLQIIILFISICSRFNIFKKIHLNSSLMKNFIIIEILD